MAKVAMPSMRRYRYTDSLAAGAIASGGTLSILIPQSVILGIYGIMTGTDVGLLFIAGILSGVLTVGLYMLTITITARLRPDSGPRADPIPMRERFRRLSQVGAIGVLDKKNATFEFFNCYF